MSFSRKLFLLVFLAAILLAALNPATSGLAYAVLVPFLVFIAPVFVAIAHSQAPRYELPPAPFLPAVASRGPPLA